MVDTTTTVLALVKQTVGANRNTWGGILNTNFDYLEETICGVHVVVTTGGTTTLSQSEARKRTISVSGTLVSDATVVVPNLAKPYSFYNGCAGDFAVLVKTSGGSATTAPANRFTEIYCDATNCTRYDINEVGQMAFFGASSVPNGWWECTGAAISRAGRGLDLFNRTSTTWGAGNGLTTFNIPDSYSAGKFLRSRTASVALGTAQADQNLSHGHAGSTASTSLSMAGTATSDGSHQHTGTDDAGGFHGHNFNVNSGTVSANHQHTGTSDYGGVDHTHDYLDSTVGAGGLIFLGGGGAFNVDQGRTTGASSAYLHQHTFTTSIETANHYHNVAGSTDGGGSSHQHTFTTAAGGSHTHSVNFGGSSATTTVTIASNGGTEARPTNLSAILCIRY